MNKRNLIAVCIAALLLGLTLCGLHWRIYSQQRPLGHQRLNKPTPASTDTIYDEPSATPWPKLGAPLRYGTPPTRVITVPSSDSIVLRTPPFAFKETSFDTDKVTRSTTTLILEDTCGGTFKKLECIKLITGYEPNVTKIDEHWEVEFKKP
jgi:hypothetical protein